jgi:FecR-like protein
MRRRIGWYASLVGVTITNIAYGAQFEEAKVTAVVHDVKLLRGQVVLRSATLNDEIRGDTAVRTGLESRSELTFPDLTLARLGANTIFSFNQKAREVNLINGAILLRVPKNSGGATITTDAVTAGIVGTTVMMEYHPRGIAKFIVLEGVARLYLKKRFGESVLVRAGEMMIIRWGATELSEPVAVDISEIMRTSLLITGFGPLPSAPLIATAETDQIQRESQGQLAETNLVIYGSGTLVTVGDETDQRFAAAPPSNPKFGRPETVKTPNPFPITNATQINTDPIITNGKITASGKIYRGATEDGRMSEYLFGSTSAFDTALRFDQFFKDLANLPVAVFKFQNLALLGNPTITVGQNGVTKLGLIGVNGITSGAPGGGLTFNGLDLLFLGTKAGSINLAGNISFQNLSTLAVYARGPGSNLTLASPISGITNLLLAAENALQIGTSLNAFSSLTVDAGGDLGSNGALAFAVQNSSPGNAAIDVTAANINATSLSTVIDNNQGGSIGGSTTINVAVAGNAAIARDATFQINGSDAAASAAININGGNYNAGGTFLGFIDGNGILTLNRATVAADVVRVGVFGSNGTLRIGGGSISANTLLHLYAPGSNGTIDFVSNVTLNTSNAIPAIVANTVTIENGVVVTVDANADGVPFPADVFTNVPNYTGSGGNASTTGTFAGNGAATQPFGQAPPFVTKRGTSNTVTLDTTVTPSPETGSLPLLGSRHPHPGPQRGSRLSANQPTFCVIDTSQLQSVLDNVAPAMNGKLHVSSIRADRKTSVKPPAGSIPRRKNSTRSVDPKAPSPVLVSNAR